MENSFAATLRNVATLKETENGAHAYSTTADAVYDLFALGGAYRSRSYGDRITLFSKAFDADPELALKCLFYLRDVRGGQGERQFFRDCFGYLLKGGFINLNTAESLLNIIPEYGRWDDIVYFYGKVNKNIDRIILDIISRQLEADLKVSCKYPTLLAKWLPSENASSTDTKNRAKNLMRGLGLSPKVYRKTLSHLRKKINVLERLMSSGEWDKIEFDKIPSRAGYLYSNCFSRREETRERYEEFIRSPKTKVNSSVLYPYEIVKPVLQSDYFTQPYDEDVIQKYWENLPNYFSGSMKSAICVVDVSGSMRGTPITVSTSLGLYCAERLTGDFKDLFITFSGKPEVVRVHGNNVCEKIRNMVTASWGFNTNLRAVFNLLFKIASNSDPEDIPDSLIIISDMEIDGANDGRDVMSDMQSVRMKWQSLGMKMPHLVYWNVNARNDTILDRGAGVTCVSGLSPVIFEMVLSGKQGKDIMLEKLLSERYSPIKIS